MPYVCLYASYLTGLALYTDSQLGRLVRAMLAYGATGEEPVFDGCERYVWPMLKDPLDRDRENYRKRCGKTRGCEGNDIRPKTQPAIAETEGLSEEPQKPKENKNKNENKNENKNVNEKEEGEEKRGRREFGGQAAPRVYDLLPKRGHFTCPLPEQTQQRFGNRVFPTGLRKSAVCGILTGTKHGSVFPGCLTNWNCPQG